MRETFLTGIHINRVRHLENIDIPISNDMRKNLVLTGKNGSGKTSVLNELAFHLKIIASGTFYSEEECREQILLCEEEIQYFKDLEGSNSYNAKEKIKYLEMWKRRLSNWTNGVITTCTSFETFRSKYQNGQFILASFSDSRSTNVNVSKNIEKVVAKPLYKITDTPCYELVKYMVSMKATQAFAREAGNRKRAIEIEKWFLKFQNILRRLYNDESLILDFDAYNFRFKICMKNRNPFDFNTMAMGYSAIFDVIGNIRPLAKIRKCDKIGV